MSVNKVVKNEAGAKWLKGSRIRFYHIVKEVTSVPDISLTVKMRTAGQTVIWF